MAQMPFNKPVYVRRRFHVEEITCVDDASDFLEAWPAAHRDLTYEMAAKACREAYLGHFPAGAVEDTFTKWARRNRILCSLEEVPVFAERNLSGSLGG